MTEGPPTPTTEPEQDSGQHQPSALASRLFSGTVYTVLFQGVDRLSGFLQNVIVARILGAAGFGILGLVVSAATVFYAPLGAFEETVMKFSAELEGERRRQIERVLGTALAVLMLIGVISAIVCVVLAEGMTSGGGDQGLTGADAARAASLVRLESLQVLMRPGVVMATGILGGLLLIDVVAKRNIGVRALLLVGSVVGAKLLGLPGVVLAILVAEAASFAVSWHIARNGLRERGVRLRLGDWRAAKELISFVSPLYLATVVAGIGPWYSMAALTGGLGAEAAGFWRVALAFFTTARAVSIAVGYTSLPMTTHLLSTGGARLAAALTRVMRVSLWVNGAVAVLLVLAARSLVPLLYGDGFAAAWPAAAIVSLSTITVALRSPLFSYLVGSGQARMLLLIEVVGIGAYVAVLWLGAAAYGPVGLAVAYGGYLFLSLLPALWCAAAKHDLAVTQLLPLWCGAMVVALGGAGIAFLLPEGLRLAIGAPYGLIVLIGAVVGLSRTDPDVLSMIADRFRSRLGAGSGRRPEVPPDEDE